MRHDGQVVQPVMCGLVVLVSEPESGFIEVCTQQIAAKDTSETRAIDR